MSRRQKCVGGDFWLIFAELFLNLRLTATPRGSATLEESRCRRCVNIMSSERRSRPNRSPVGGGGASAAAFAAAESEEIALRKRVRDMRLAALEDEVKARRLEFLREDEQIRVEIMRIRKLVVQAHMSSPPPATSRHTSSPPPATARPLVSSPLPATARLSPGAALGRSPR